MRRGATHRAAVAAMLTATVAIAGCSRDRGESAVDRDDPQAACKVVSRAEVRAVVNVPPENDEITFGLWRDVPPIRDLTGVTFCRYGDTGNTLTLFVGLSTFGRDANAFARRAFDKWRADTDSRLKQAGRRALQPVDGLGQQAVWSGDATGGDLVVLDAGGILTVTIGGQEPALDRAKKLAAKGLRRI